MLILLFYTIKPLFRFAYLSQNPSCHYLNFLVALVHALNKQAYLAVLFAHSLYQYCPYFIVRPNGRIWLFGIYPLSFCYCGIFWCSGISSSL